MILKFGLLDLSALHRICIPAGAIVLVAHALNYSLDIQSYNLFSRRLLIFIIVSYVAIKSKQTRKKLI